MTERAVFDSGSGDPPAPSGGGRDDRGNRRKNGKRRGNRQKTGERRNNRREAGDGRGDRPKLGARSASLVRQIPPAMRRFLAVVGLAALAGLAALIVVSSGSTTYEQESSFAIRPSDTVAPAAVPDVVGTLSDPDSAVTESIVDILGSARLQASSARAAGVPPDAVAASGAEYSWLATRRPGSTIVDLKVSGPDPAKVTAMQAAAARDAADLVESNYSVYRLESLNASASANQVGSKTAQTVGLAVVLGALLGIGLLFAERKLRASLGEWSFERGRDGRPVAAGDLSGETDQLESTLRESLGTGASVRRVGPGRIEVAPPGDAPDRETARRKR
jgi:hypothetical protein